MASAEVNLAKFEEIARRGFQDELPPEIRARFDEAVRQGYVTLPDQQAQPVQGQPPATAQQPPSDPTPLRTMTDDATMALGGAAANIISSGVGQVAGGLAGLASAGIASLTGEDDPAALGEGVRQRVEESFTIPAGEGGEKVLAGVGEFVSDLPFMKPIGEFLAPIGEGAKSVESEVLERFGPEAATALKVLPVAAFELIAARMGLGPIKKAGEKVSKATTVESLTNIQTTDKKRIAESLKAGITDTETAGFKLMKPNADGTPRVEVDTTARAAEKQGFEASVIAPIKAGTPQDKKKFLEMTRIKQRAMENAEFAIDNRPSDVLGDSVMTRLRLVQRANKISGREIDKLSKDLRGKPIDISSAADGFAQGLEDLGISLVPDKRGGFKPDFNQSTLAPGDRGPIKEVIRQMSLRGNGAIDGRAAHEMKRVIDNNVTFGKNRSGGMTRDAENLLKDFRFGLKESLNEQFPEYGRANLAYSETIDALDAFQDVAGKKMDLSGPRGDKAVGTLMRRELSNAQSRITLKDARDGIEEIAAKYEFFRGTDARLIEGPPKKSVLNDSIGKQIIYVDELERRFGTQATTGFEGGLTKAGKTVARGGIKEAAVDVAFSAADKLLGKNDRKAFQAIRKLLKE